MNNVMSFMSFMSFVNFVNFMNFMNELKGKIYELYVLIFLRIDGRIVSLGNLIGSHLSSSWLGVSNFTSVSRDFMLKNPSN
ncbi:MAG: hypothetical protein RLZZ338_1861 [Cyanobacteriota bacterium]|jgi:hypothetical protein